MQTIVRLFAGFVTRILGQKAPTTAVTVDTTASDQAWWEDQVLEALGDWWCEQHETSCVCCGTRVIIARWQFTSEGDECNDCITRYDADEVEIEDAMSVKISF